MSARLELLDAGLPGVISGFTTRAGGVSAQPYDELNLARHVADQPAAVSANRQAVAHRIGAGAVAFPEQVHGAQVGVLTATDEVRDGEWTGGAGCDAVVTTRLETAIGVLVADCMPVLLADPDAGVVAAAHAGRRGLAAGVLEATVAAMSRLGAQASTTRAVIGPAICGRCYEVPAELREEIDALVPGSATTTAAGTPGLDLPAGALGVLRRAGLADVTVLGACTAEDRRFYSYRRDGVTGRFAGIVMLATGG